MNKKIEIEECPYCGGIKFGKGQQMAQGNIVPTESLLKGAFSKGIPMYHTICMNCGSIVRSYVENTDKFN